MTEPVMDFRIDKDIDSQYDPSLLDLATNLFEEVKQESAKSEKDTIYSIGSFEMNRIHMYYGGYLDKLSNKYTLRVSLDKTWFNNLKEQVVEGEGTELLLYEDARVN